MLYLKGILAVAFPLRSGSRARLHRQVFGDSGRIGSILPISEIADHVDTVLGSRHSDVEQIGRPVNP